MTLIGVLLAVTASAGTLCNDGWVSPSSGSGTCSHHGGVFDHDTRQAWFDPEPRAYAQQVAEGYCRSLQESSATSACMLGVTSVNSANAETSCTSDLAVSALQTHCLNGALTLLEAEKRWLEANPPEPPPDPITSARMAYAKRFGTAADVDRLRMRETFDRLMSIPQERRWMLVPSMQLQVALTTMNAPSIHLLTNSETLPVALRFFVVGTCVSYSDYYKTLVLKTDAGNIVTVSAYGTRRLESGPAALSEYLEAREAAKMRGSNPSEFCFSDSYVWPWEK